MSIYCSVCDGKISKYKLDIKACGGIPILVDRVEKYRYVCEDCAKIIARSLIDR